MDILCGGKHTVPSQWRDLLLTGCQLDVVSIAVSLVSAVCLLVSACCLWRCSSCRGTAGRDTRSLLLLALLVLHTAELGEGWLTYGRPDAAPDAATAAASLLMVATATLLTGCRLRGVDVPLWLLSGAVRAARAARMLQAGIEPRTVRLSCALAAAAMHTALAMLEVVVLCHGAASQEEEEGVVYRHARAGLFSRVTFSWLLPLLAMGWACPLELEDLGRIPRAESTALHARRLALVYRREQERCGAKASLWRCYWLTCWPGLLLGGVLKLTGDLVGMVAPMGISVILAYVASEEQSQSIHPTWPEFVSNGYVMGVLVFMAVLMQGSVSQACTHVLVVQGVRLQGALQAMVYSKALRLRQWTLSEDGHHRHHRHADSTQAASGDSPITDVGSVTNLLAEDTANVMHFVWIGHYMWAIPLKIAVLMYLLHSQLGVSALIGAALCVLVMTPLQVIIGKKMSANSKAITEATDERLRHTNELIQGMKYLKLYAWEDIFGKRVLDSRQRELSLLAWDSVYWALMTFLTHASTVVVTLVTFVTFLLSEEGVPTAGALFTGLALFNQLTVPLFIFPVTVPVVIGALVSTRRLTHYLLLPEIGDDVRTARVDDVMSTPTNGDDDDVTEGVPMPEMTSHVVTVEEGSVFSWGNDVSSWCLCLPRVCVPRGQLTMVLGRVGSGKTSLLSAMLGEMQRVSGRVTWARGVGVAYAGQTPWLLDATLRDNIVFGEGFTPGRYQRVVTACGLLPDMAILPLGDLTGVGVGGVSLSGGQRQRVAVARALYSRADVVILDDPLSALDNQLGQQVFEDGVLGLLVRRQRTVVMVNHRMELLHHAHHIIAMEAGSVQAQGSLAHLEAAHPQLVRAWRASADEDDGGGHGRGRARAREAARERWRLVRLVSRFEAGLRRAAGVDLPFTLRRRTFSGSRHLSHDLPLPIDERDDFLAGAVPGGGGVGVGVPGDGSRRRPRTVQRMASLQPDTCGGGAPAPVIRQLSTLSTPAMPLSRSSPWDSRHSQQMVMSRLISTTSAVSDDWEDDDVCELSPTIPRGVPPSTPPSNIPVVTPLTSHRGFHPYGPTNIPPSRNIPEGTPAKILPFSSTPEGTPANIPPSSSIPEGTPSNIPPCSSIPEGTPANIPPSSSIPEGRPPAITGGGHSDEREYGRVPRLVYLQYMGSCGLTMALSYVAATMCWQGVRVYTDYWLTGWGAGGALDRATVIHYLWQYALLSGVSIVLSVTSNGCGQWSGARGRHHLHDRFLRTVMRSPVRVIESTPVGRLMNRFSTDMAIIDKKISTSLQRLLQFLLLCVSAIVVNGVLCTWSLLVAVPVCAVYYVVQRFYRCSSRELTRLDSLTRSPVLNHLSETLTGLTTVRAFQQQGRFSAAMDTLMDTHTNTLLICNASNRWLGVALDYLGAAIVLVSVLTAAHTPMTSMTPMSPAVAGLAVNYTLLVPVYLTWLVKYVADVESCMCAVHRLLGGGGGDRGGGVEDHLLDDEEGEEEEDTRVTGPPPPQPWPHAGEVLFEGVSLSYGGGRGAVIEGLDLHIPAGQKVGLCGRSGGGKTTVAMALLGMVGVTRGRILIDGVDIKGIRVAELRGRLAVIPQEAALFTGTIRANLDPRGRHTDAELWRSLELAQLAEVVAGMPGGLESEVREGGAPLSWGQRQQVLVARAGLHPSPLLLMDEATAWLDPATEAAVMGAAGRAFRPRTVITIAHRLSTIMHCDRILVMDTGRLVEDGSPGQLLARPMGIFSSMVRAYEEAGEYPHPL